MLPHLAFSEWFVKGNEIFLKTSDEVRRVVCQGIATTVLVTIGVATDLVICFPIPSYARIYIRTRTVANVGFRERFYFIGEFGVGPRFYKLPKRPKYRYGVELNPWSYLHYLKTDMREIRSRVVNYVIENCCAGYDGILLQFRDEFDSKTRDKEWFKIFCFSSGNEYHFRNEVHTQILELLPHGTGNKRFWEPAGGWKRFKRITHLPGKIR